MFQLVLSIEEVRPSWSCLFSKVLIVYNLYSLYKEFALLVNVQKTFQHDSHIYYLCVAPHIKTKMHEICG